jgi:hypothetical protein
VGKEPPKAPTPDIQLGVSLRARTLRFEKVPEVKAGFDGTPGYVARTEGEREALPSRVKAGVTYRRIMIRGRTTLRIDE